MIAIPAVEQGRNVTYYFTDDETADEVFPRATDEALSLIGAWSDLDWDEMVEALDRIRHQSGSPPLGEPRHPI